MKITAETANRKTIRENIVLNFIMISLLAQAYNVYRCPKLPCFFCFNYFNSTKIQPQLFILIMLQNDAVVKGNTIP